ncbi:hypothetical protein [Lachnospira multipara]|uniref:Uncharacterized protein n=1 Tax=Lachnospira multipara TaxID=28051 RepID=A0A1H5WXU5_9FIRM|nr:hypothetical protein [Lachnospira multipara]SEG03906.1 hypothetical protein SAMN05216537_11924 [Lachnospira multipara]
MNLAITAFALTSTVYSILCMVMWYLLYRFSKELSKETAKMYSIEIRNIVDTELKKHQKE